jgi:hypothetical protein
LARKIFKGEVEGSRNKGAQIKSRSYFLLAYIIQRSFIVIFPYMYLRHFVQIHCLSYSFLSSHFIYLFYSSTGFIVEKYPCGGVEGYAARKLEPTATYPHF